MKRFTTILILLITIIAFAQESSWQQSETINIQLGVRDKNSNLEEYKATFKVTETTTEKVVETTITVTADQWGFVNFPEDFGVDALKGDYDWACTVADKIVTYGKFEFKKTGNMARVLTYKKVK
ncbi:MAG: hypothetical protein PF574_10000 [Candidatus Delongbacteria bacterium]|jgi:hypothetical protein|nr:hypothetical protein [Candidatus Delongbacteria bacterium]